ncbi:MAG: acyltransferase family protein [Akkermansia sp.]|nr:acyltransferase family protein [Akkermansia sp.]
MAQQLNKRIESIYLLKALSSFFVVVLHSGFFLMEWVYFIIGVGTPCFLCITGYLLYTNNLSRELEKCIKWAKKSFKLLLICCLLYWGFYEVMGWKEISIMEFMLNLLHGSSICIVLWYLAALWQALLLFGLIRRYVPKLIYVFPFVFAVAYAIRTHPDVVCPSLDWYEAHFWRCNAIVMSLPFLCTGYLIRKHKEWLLSHIKVVVWLPIVLVLLLGEYLLRKHYDWPLSCYFVLTYPCIVLLLLFCVRFPSLKLPFINYVGLKHSANIYYFHIAVLGIGNSLGIWPSKWEAVMLWLLCIPVSMLFNTVMKGVSQCFTRKHA